MLRHEWKMRPQKNGRFKNQRFDHLRLPDVTGMATCVFLCKNHPETHPRLKSVEFDSLNHCRYYGLAGLTTLLELEFIMKTIPKTMVSPNNFCYSPGSSLTKTRMFFHELRETSKTHKTHVDWWRNHSYPEMLHQDFAAPKLGPFFPAPAMTATKAKGFQSKPRREWWNQRGNFTIWECPKLTNGYRSLIGLNFFQFLKCSEQTFKQKFWTLWKYWHDPRHIRCQLLKNISYFLPVLQDFKRHGFWNRND